MEDAASIFRMHFKVSEVSRSQDLWALHKPPRVLSHPNPPARQAQNAILRVPYDFKREMYASPEQAGASRAGAFLIHRLDQETSGLILLAFRDDLAASLKELFYRREISKEYCALLRGSIRDAEGVWRDHLRKQRVSGHLKVTVQRGARPNAETRFRVIERFPDLGATLVKLYPETGKTHQLRVQGASRGYPVAGDERYGDFAWNRELRETIGLRRMFLHAERIELRHPDNGRKWKFLAKMDTPLAAPLQAARGK